MNLNTLLIHRIFLLGVLVWALFACSTEDKPEPPTIDIGAFPPAARPLVRGMYKRLLTDPHDAQANGTLAMLSHAHNKPALALDLYQRAESQESTTFGWIYLQAVVLTDQGRQIDAIGAFRRALSINGKYPPARLHLAELLASQDQVKESRSIFEALLRDRPDYPRGVFGYGQLLLSTGEQAEATKLFKSAIELVPHYGAAHYALAQLYEIQGNQEQAGLYRNLFQKYAKFGPLLDDPLMAQVEDMRGSVQQAIVKAGRLSADGKLQEAANIFLGIVEKDPENLVAHINLIGLFGSLGQIDRAKSHYEAGRELSSDNVNLHQNYGVLMLRQQKYAEAIPVFRAAIEAEPDYSAAYKYLGICLQAQQKLDEALESYQTAVYTDPLDHQAGYLLGELLVTKGEISRAIEVFERILEPPTPNTSSYLRALAKAYLVDGNVGQAEDTFRRARTSASDHGQTSQVAAIDDELASLTQETEVR